MSVPALRFGLMRMMRILLAAARGHAAVMPLRIFGRRLVKVQRLLGILMRRAGAAMTVGTYCATAKRKLNVTREAPSYHK